jgi:hypothetical protein
MCKFRHIFDFDDTLAHIPSAIVHATNKITKEKFSLDTNQLKEHVVDTTLFDYDWSQFQCLLPTYIPIQHTLNLIKELYESFGQEALTILTARACPIGPKEFLNIFGMSDINVVALGIGTLTNNPHDKARWIKQHIIENQLKYVAFYEDNLFYIRDVEKLQQEFPNVIFNIQHVTS